MRAWEWRLPEVSERVIRCQKYPVMTPNVPKIAEANEKPLKILKFREPTYDFNKLGFELSKPSHGRCHWFESCSAHHDFNNFGYRGRTEPGWEVHREFNCETPII
jgi:hypothetical protein